MPSILKQARWWELPSVYGPYCLTDHPAREADDFFQQYEVLDMGFIHEENPPVRRFKAIYQREKGTKR